MGTLTRTDTSSDRLIKDLLPVLEEIVGRAPAYGEISLSATLHNNAIVKIGVMVQETRIPDSIEKGKKLAFSSNPGEGHKGSPRNEAPRQSLNNNTQIASCFVP